MRPSVTPRQTQPCVVCAHMKHLGRPLCPSLSLNGSYVRGETDLGPQADVKCPPEIPSALSMKCALVFLFMVELELSLCGVFRFSPWHTSHMLL